MLSPARNTVSLQLVGQQEEHPAFKKYFHINSQKVYIWVLTQSNSRKMAQFNKSEHVANRLVMLSTTSRDPLRLSSVARVWQRMHYLTTFLVYYLLLFSFLLKVVF